MHVFAVFLFFAFGVMGLTMLVDRLFHTTLDMKSLVAMAVGVGLAWLAYFNMWAGWTVAVRKPWIGVTLTGLALGGGALFIHAIMGFFASLHRKIDDQAAAIEKSDLRRVA